MTKKTKIIIAAAVCAAIGIGGGAIALLYNKPQEEHCENFIEDNVEGDLQTEFNGPDNMPSMNTQNGQVIAGESGWYCMPMQSEDYHNLIVYTDAVTRVQTPLCSRVECTHDTKYCVANNSQFYGKPYTYYDGALYGLAADAKTAPGGTPKDGQMLYYGDRGALCLMRYSPDGTTLTKLCNLQDALEGSIEHATIEKAEIIGHRGGLWIAVEFATYYGEYRTEYEEKLPGAVLISESYRGYSLLHYDIAKDKLTMVIDNPIGAGSGYFTVPTHLCGVGDYVYFLKANTDVADPYDPYAIYRVDIRTGAVEKVVSGAFVSYAVTGDKLVYLKSETGWLNPDNLQTVPCVLDLNTGKTQLLLADGSHYYDDIQCTEEYVLLRRCDGNPQITVFDWDGKLQCIMDNPDSTLLDLAVCGDRLYGTEPLTDIEGRMYYTSLSEAFAAFQSGEEPKWVLAYDGLQIYRTYKRQYNIYK